MQEKFINLVGGADKAMHFLAGGLITGQTKSVALYFSFSLTISILVGLVVCTIVAFSKEYVWDKHIARKGTATVELKDATITILGGAVTETVVLIIMFIVSLCLNLIA